MRTSWAALIVLSLVLSGCAEGEDKLEDGAEPATGAPDEGPSGDTVATPTPAATPRTSATAAPPSTTPTTAPAQAPEATATPIARVTDGPAGDVDRDGIPDALETSLASSCDIAGASCASLGLLPLEVGLRDLVFVQVGRGGIEQDWRLPASVWASTLTELANHSIRAQVADLGLRDDIDVEATWDDTANAGRYWHLWVLYDDPATAITTDASGSQTYNLIKIAERESELEMRATILHEAYHALLGDLRSHRSACTNEEIGGPSHSADPESVLYTSPECETNEGSVYRISADETAELREEPFDVFRQMNADDWFATSDG